MNVVLIMTDGLRPDAISPTLTPTLSAFMARGAYTLTGRSVMPSITLPCHTSIFHSVPPSQHGIQENFWKPLDTPAEGLVERLRTHGKRTGFIHNWEPLRDLNRPGALYYSFFIDTGYDLNGDSIIAETAVRHITRRDFDFTFVYFASIDVAGHLSGWMSDGYLKQAQTVDALVGQVLDATPDDTTVIIQSDHGGHDTTHGEDIPEDMTIPWMIAGPGVRPHHALQQPVSLLDTAPTIAHRLGVTAPRAWEGRVVEEAFDPVAEA
jgi:predicted AlkP superfamily pyrophosphatase or phosphodiesterase